MSFEADLLDTTWSFRRALRLAVLSELAYAPKTDVKYTLENDFGLSLRDYMPTGASQGFVAEGEDVVALVFCGTNEITDWLVNLKIIAVETPWGVTHRGFLAAYQAIASQAQAAVQHARETGKTLWITGHSLGGALAVIAAHDLFQVGDKSGLCTFGQPRALRLKDDDLNLTSRLPLGYHRLVNGRDIVTRIPPTLPHTGALVPIGRRRGWFGAESEETSQELPALTEKEFQELQDKLQAINDQARRGAGNAEAVTRSVEGIIPGVKDHRVYNYVSELRALAPDDETDSREVFVPPVAATPLGQRRSSQSISGGVFGTRGSSGSEFQSGGTDVFLALRPRDKRPGSTRSSGAEGLEAVESAAEAEPLPAIPVLFELSNADWEPGKGITVLSRLGMFVTARVDADGLDALQRDHKVKSMDVSRSGGGLELTESVPFVKGQPVDRGEIEEDGSNAIVGVIDTGIDILHHAFSDADGQSRIVAIWDQFDDDTGPSPREVDPKFPFDFGTLYTAEAIAEIRAGTRDVPPYMRDPGGHGTHVSGIATGRATGALPDGVAPGAKIALVIPSMDLDDERQDPNSLGYSVSHVNALQFLRTLAKTQNALSSDALPIAINVSLGMNAGAHDGQSLLEAAFDSVTNLGTEPGVVIVKSAGNERRQKGHCHVDLALGRVDVDWRSKDVDRSVDYFEAWFDHMDELEFVLRSPFGGETEAVSTSKRRIGQVVDGNIVHVRLRTNHPDNGDSVLYLTVEPQSRSILPGHWKLEVRGLRISAQTTGLHIWAERTNARAVEFINASERHTISVPGTAEEIITVGATDVRDPFPGVIDDSSFGPTRSNASKPEISAPGLAIVSAAANQNDLSAARPDTGTSMAAPHVTGAMALALSRRHVRELRQFNTQQLRSCLIRSAQYGSGVHNKGFGFGILDIAAFLSCCDQEE